MNLKKYLLFILSMIIPFVTLCQETSKGQNTDTTKILESPLTIAENTKYKRGFIYLIENKKSEVIKCHNENYTCQKNL